LSTAKATTTTDRKKRATELMAILRGFRPYQRAGWIGLGKAGREMMDQKLFKEAGFDSFDECVENALGSARSTVFEAMSILKGFGTSMPESTMLQIPKENLKVLLKLPERKRQQKGILKIAASATSIDFKKYLSKEHDLHLLDRSRMQFTDVPVDARPRIELAYHGAKLLGGWPSDDAVHPLEMMSDAWLDEMCAITEFEGIRIKGLTNFKALEKINKERKHAG
jgi:hypothetical protein